MSLGCKRFKQLMSNTTIMLLGFNYRMPQWMNYISITCITLAMISNILDCTTVDFNSKIIKTNYRHSFTIATTRLVMEKITRNVLSKSLIRRRNLLHHDIKMKFFIK